MKIKISKQEYKKHRFPVCLLLYYVLLSLAAVILLEILATVIVHCGLGGFMDKLAGIVVMLLAGGVLWFVECLVCRPKLKKDKVYRGIGLLRFLAICSVLCPITFIAFIIFLNVADITYIFFNIVTLFVEFAIPFLLSLEMRTQIKYSIRFCPNCGLLNTYVITDRATVDLGTKHKFHNEGGYTRTWKTSVGIMVQDVPTTAVYDGEFQKCATTITYKCSVCGNIKTDHTTTENRV